MGENEISEYIQNILTDFDDQEENEEISLVKQMISFNDYGMLTMDEGFVIKTKDGEEFAVTIKKRN